ncbi:MAG TPA: efflux RND transporter periplasmic adaptor subunit [Burkholderiales bacterium]|nr:efflux RND transporter periplasmic adaptor subunit [Burkholderiales bacterium]
MDAPDKSPAAAPNGNNGKRKRLLMIVLGSFALIGLLWAAYWLLIGRFHESTDDAYVGGNVVQITPQIAGTVIAIGADDTNFVKAGQTLVVFDKADTGIALEDAESKLAKTVREVRNLKATAEQLAATVELRRADLAKADDDLARREKIVGSGAVSAEDVQHARDAQKTAQADLTAAEQQFAATRALVDNTTLANHPDVRNAAAQVRSAYLDYARTELPAPVAGFVAKRSVQVGQHVTPGTMLMAVVPLDQVWVDANFKEGQLAQVRVGQPATLTADLYGGRVEYHGTVAGFGAGTGSAFALLPAQNATGNWIKIVQRLPVRVKLDPKEIAEHPLQIGLSMQVDIDTHDRGGPRLAQTANAQSYQTDAFKSADALAAERIAAIIAANSSGAKPGSADSK